MSELHDLPRVLFVGQEPETVILGPSATAGI